MPDGWNSWFHKLIVDVERDEDVKWKRWRCKFYNCNLDILNEKILIRVIKNCKIDPNNFLVGIKNQNIKDELISATKEAFDKETFGVPTYVVNNKIFWGQDRLEFALDEYFK